MENQLTKMVEQLNKETSNDAKEVRDMSKGMREMANILDEVAVMMESNEEIGDEELSALLGRFMLVAIKLNSLNGDSMDLNSILGGK